MQPETIDAFFQPPSAMIVEPNRGVRKNAAAMFKSLGYDVTIVEEGRDALFQLQRHPRSLVLTDMELPVINGYQLARRIKMSHPATKVAIMTGMDVVDVASLIKGGGIDGWLFKPFGLKALKTVLRNMGLPSAVGAEG